MFQVDPETAEIIGGICAPPPMPMSPMFVARTVADGGIDELLLADASSIVAETQAQNPLTS
jgi:hypothetical protein